MNETLIALLSPLKRNPAAASEGKMRQLQAAAQATLSPDYLAFLRESDGAEGFVGAGGYVAIWPADEVLRATVELELSVQAPWLLPFASNGSSAVYAFTSGADASRSAIVKVDYLDIGDRTMEESYGSTLQDLLFQLAGEILNA